MSTISPDRGTGLHGLSRAADSPIAAAGREILGLVEDQVALGPRAPGTGPHDQLARRLEQRLREHHAEVTVQEFAVTFQGSALHCANIVGMFRARAHSSGGGSPVLVGTHYDTRVRADRDPDPARRECPIPGANDGGSGTAVLLHILPWLSRAELARDVAVAFFDAEDLGNIDGKDFSLGAEWCATHPVAGFAPAEMVAVDMVGGRDMVLDIDAYSLEHPASLKLTREIFKRGFAQGGIRSSGTSRSASNTSSPIIIHSFAGGPRPVFSSISTTPNGTRRMTCRGRFPRIPWELPKQLCSFFCRARQGEPVPGLPGSQVLQADHAGLFLFLPAHQSERDPFLFRI